MCPTLCDPMDCSLPGSSVHGISITTVLIHISRTVVTLFFHLVTWGVSHAFIYGFIVKQVYEENTYLEEFREITYLEEFLF